MELRKIAKASVNRIQNYSCGKTLICRRNRFDMFENSNFKSPVFLSANISNASDAFYNPQTEQAILVNTSGKAILYDIEKGIELTKLSFGYEMFSHIEILNDNQNFYYIDKKRQVRRLSLDGKYSKRVFRNEEEVSRIVFKNGYYYLFRRIAEQNISSYEIKCYKGEILVDKLKFTPEIRICDGHWDLEEEKMVMSVYEKAAKENRILQRNFYVFIPESLEVIPLFANPLEWKVIYGYSSCLQAGLFAYANGYTITVIDIETGQIIAENIFGKMEEYSSDVEFLSPTELLIGTTNGLYLAEL